LWGQPELDKPTTNFDSCGLFAADGSIIIPSKTPAYSTAQLFLETIGVPLMPLTRIEIVDDDPNGLGCFNSAVSKLGGLVGFLVVATLF
jgi:hypothetical protein